MSSAGLGRARIFVNALTRTIAFVETGIPGFARCEDARTSVFGGWNVDGLSVGAHHGLDRDVVAVEQHSVVTRNATVAVPTIIVLFLPRCVHVIEIVVFSTKQNDGMVIRGTRCFPREFPFPFKRTVRAITNAIVSSWAIFLPVRVRVVIFSTAFKDERTLFKFFVDIVHDRVGTIVNESRSFGKFDHVVF